MALHFRLRCPALSFFPSRVPWRCILCIDLRALRDAVSCAHVTLLLSRILILVICECAHFTSSSTAQRDQRFGSKRDANTTVSIGLRGSVATQHRCRIESLPSNRPSQGTFRVQPLRRIRARLPFTARADHRSSGPSQHRRPDSLSHACGGRRSSPPELLRLRLRRAWLRTSNPRPAARTP